jgi:deltex-like protein
MCLSCYVQGDQTTDVSKTNPAFPYIINFCNLTQVRNNTGYVRSIRRVQQAPYPLIKVQPEELQSVVTGIVIFALQLKHV